MNRINKTQNLLTKLDIDALLIQDSVQLFYLTGLILSAGSLLITKDYFKLIVDGRYIQTAKEKFPDNTFLLSAEAWKNLSPNCGDIRKIGIDGDKLSHQQFLDIQMRLSHCEIISLKNPLYPLRSIKDSSEIYLLEEAAALGCEGVLFVTSLLKEGITERAVATELEIFWKRKGGNGLAFEPIIAFGSNSAMPHYRAGNTALKNGDTVLIDIGVTLQHYHSDKTRVVFFGEPNPEMLKIYDIVKEAKKRAIALAYPGTTIGRLDEVARSYIAENGYGECFTHSLGHGIGLEVHEPPTLRSLGQESALQLQPGMAITIEPGIYLPGKGGIRLEDTILITDSGCRVITPLNE